MKIQNGKMRVSLLVLAVQGALLSMCAMPAYAEDDELAALKNPTNVVEIGAANVSKSSAKFGEYTGSDKSGAEVIGNFRVRGGNAYGDGNGTKRWSISGSDLGLTSRALGATVSDQGSWNLGIGYDELKHNITDTYQTPYVGSNGGNNFTLPSTFGVVTTGGVLPGTQVLNATQQAALHKVEISSTRKNISLNGGVILSPEWSASFEYNNMVQTGAKLMAFGSTGGGTGLATILPGASAEAVSILPNPTNYKTDSVNLALNWAGEKGHMTASYFGSFFRDGYDRVTFQTYGVTTGTNTYIQTMGTSPGNKFQQLNLNGGFALAEKTKLTGGLSYGRNTQNDAFVVDSYMMLTPPVNNSLNGLIVNTHGDLKLTNQDIKDLALSAGVKYDQRDNRTASNLYNFNALSGTTAHYAHYPKTPLSNRKTQLELAGDYRLDNNQNIRLAYNRENVKRWCNQYATGGTTLNVDAYVAGVNNYPAGTNCVVATASKDDKIGATYRVKAGDSLKLNVGYSYSKRTTDSDPNAIAAFISLNGNPNVATGTIRGLNAGDFLGFHPYFNASRKQQMVKAGANWQASEQMSLGVIGRYTADKYDTQYGVQNGSSWSMNLDATYNYSENTSVSTYLTQQHRQRELKDQLRSPTSAASAASTSATSAAGLNQPSGATWTNQLTDKDTTVGVGAKQGGLMGSKLELAQDLSYSLGQTGYGTQLNYAAATSTASGSLTCSSPQLLMCGDLPVIRNRVVQFKFTGNYRLDKSASIGVGYIYRNLKSSDYYYNGLQYGSTPAALMPTNQQSPNYSVNVVYATYIYSFR